MCSGSVSSSCSISGTCCVTLDTNHVISHEGQTYNIDNMFKTLIQFKTRWYYSISRTFKYRFTQLFNLIKYSNWLSLQWIRQSDIHCISQLSPLYWYLAAWEVRGNFNYGSHASDPMLQPMNMAVIKCDYESVII